MSKTLKKFALMLHDAGILLTVNQCCEKPGCVDLALKEANKGESLAGDDDVACKNDATPMKRVKTKGSRYQANQQINYDQVPFTLEQNARKVFVLSAPSGADKRFGTLQMHLHSGTNEKAWHEFSRKPGTIIFGKGVGKKAKQHADHPAVHVARHKLIIRYVDHCFRIIHMPAPQISEKTSAQHQNSRM